MDRSRHGRDLITRHPSELVSAADPRNGNIGGVTSPQVRHWGDDRALLDNDEARCRLLDAAGRCIVRRGDTEIRMSEVADEAGVVRSTVYRYFGTRDELLLALLLRRIDAAFARWVGTLRRPQDASSSIRQLVLKPVAAVDSGDALNLALYASESSALVPVLATGAEAVTDVLVDRIGPLFRQWQAESQIYSDLSLRETAQWIAATSSFLLTEQWRNRPASAKRRFIDRYVLRALVC